MDETKIYVFAANGLSSEEAIRRSVRLYLGDEQAQLPPIVRGEHGKPYFDAPHAPCFSVSHSGACLVCAVSDDEVGLDLQKHTAPKNNVAVRFFHPDEAQYAARGGAEAFFAVWTAKESYVKYTAKGIDGEFSHFSTVENGCIRQRLGDAVLQHVAFREGYSMCLCTSRPTLVRVFFVEE